MSSILSSSQGVVLATAMAAFSGTVIIYAFCKQKTQFSQEISQPHQRILRSCLSSDGKKREKKKKKRVRFADDVVDPTGNNEEFRKQRNFNGNSSNSSSNVHQKSEKIKKMPANRIALYNGILRDRVVQRLAYSY
ncbi:hypothetical protein RJ641_026202 [Dillenia turbinata]|uniref:Uncharacterized protein n=1 Tax=Dillenia turbinata TaxID=194707 RepID=A0AAN8W4C0_9MAGN